MEFRDLFKRKGKGERDAPSWPYSAANKLKEYNEGRKRHSLDEAFPAAKTVSFYIITAIGFILTALYAVVCCGGSYTRLAESIRDFGVSIAYYGTLILPFYEIEPTLNEIPTVAISFLPETWELFVELLNKWWTAIFVPENFNDYLIEVALFLDALIPVLIALLPLVLLLAQLPSIILDERDVKWLQKTKGLKLFEKIKYKLYFPAKQYVLDFIEWQKSHYYYNVLFVLWLGNLNILSVTISFFAWYFYFAKSFDLLNIYIQAVKLSIDVLVFIDSSFLVLTVGIAIYIFNRWRKSTALKSLNGKLAQNIEVAKSLPCAVLICGPMGVGKTKFQTFLGLIYTLIFRNRALKDMNKNVNYFPDFPWEKFDLILQAQIKKRVIYNLASTEEWIRKEREAFESSGKITYIYGYDYFNYPLEVPKGNGTIYIWDALENYAKQSLVYLTQSSLLVANYSVREDYIIENCGNYIRYHYNFFAEQMPSESSHFAHILNYDSLRMGKLLVTDSKYKDSFEFSAILCTELGKERENSLETQHLKRDDAECNAKNDLLAARIMYIRHGATIDNFCYAIIISDEQRAMKLDINIRANCEQITISESSKTKLAYPFFYVESLLYDVIVPRADDFLDSYKVAKGSRGLIYKSVLYLRSAVFRMYQNTVDKYGYQVIKFFREREDLQGKVEAKPEKFYMLYGAIYNDRYKTDTHARFIRKRALKSGIGLDDYPCYETTDASDEELHNQASLHIQAMDKLNKGEE